MHLITHYDDDRNVNNKKGVTANVFNKIDLLRTLLWGQGPWIWMGYLKREVALACRETNHFCWCRVGSWRATRERNRKYWRMWRHCYDSRGRTCRSRRPEIKTNKSVEVWTDYCCHQKLSFGETRGWIWPAPLYRAKICLD